MFAVLPGVKDVERLPTASTCHNTLKLPNCECGPREMSVDFEVQNQGIITDFLGCVAVDVIKLCGSPSAFQVFFIPELIADNSCKAMAAVHES